MIASRVGNIGIRGGRRRRRLAVMCFFYPAEYAVLQMHTCSPLHKYHVLYYQRLLSCIPRRLMMVLQMMSRIGRRLHKHTYCSIICTRGKFAHCKTTLVLCVGVGCSEGFSCGSITAELGDRLGKQVLSLGLSLGCPPLREEQCHFCFQVGT